MNHYFPKPAPLSPQERDVERRKKSSKKYKGVDVEKSFYYLWFEYLRRSDDYKKACGYEVDMTKEEKKEYASWFKQKKTKELISDFGNIHSEKYDGYLGFWAWWTEKDKEGEKRGEKLFAIKAHTVEGFATNDELLESKDQIQSGEVKVIILPTNVTRSAIERRLAKLLKQLVLKPKAVEARYHPSNLKVDVNSLDKCLKAYDMRIEGKTTVEIGAEFLYLDTQTPKFKLDSKNTCNVTACRYLKKAEDNIKAVENRMFGLGHKNDL